jgi:hypothetical protein
VDWCPESQSVRLAACQVEVVDRDHDAVTAFGGTTQHFDEETRQLGYARRGDALRHVRNQLTGKSQQDTLDSFNGTRTGRDRPIHVRNILETATPASGLDDEIAAALLRYEVV